MNGNGKAFPIYHPQQNYTTENMKKRLTNNNFFPILVIGELDIKEDVRLQETLICSDADHIVMQGGNIMSDYDYNSTMSQIQQIQQNNAQTISQYTSQIQSSTSSSGQLGSQSSGLESINLRDYGLIRNGSYSKLIKAYYNKLTKENASTEIDSSESLATSRSDAKNLKKAAEAMKKSNFDKVEQKVKDEDGKETTKKDYDRDTLYKNASEFVKSYNALIDSVSDLNSTTLLKKAVGMTNQTASSRNLLEDVGITINSDNTLSIDEETFKSADMNKIKTLFQGHNSYASKISYKASEIYNLSDNVARTQASGGNRTYTQTGSYSNIDTSTMYDSFL